MSKQLILMVEGPDQNWEGRRYAGKLVRECTKAHIILAGNIDKALHVLKSLKPQILLVDEKVKPPDRRRLYQRLEEMELERAPLIVYLERPYRLRDIIDGLYRK